MGALRRRLDRVWALGRRSERMYLRFYPNPGFMVPWFKGRQLLWNRHDGWYRRLPGERHRPKFGARKAE